jgi:hypothetical protein
MAYRVGRVGVLIFLIVIVASVFWAFRMYSGPQAPPPRTESTPPPAATPAAAPAAPAAQQQPDTPRVATDPSYRVERGRKVTSLQDVPDYPGSTLVGSAEQAKAGEPAEGYRAVWKTKESVPAVMEYYRKALVAQGWSFKPAQNPASSAEQIAYIKKGTLDGYVSAEAEKGETEITVSLQDVRQASKKGQR